MGGQYISEDERTEYGMPTDTFGNNYHHIIEINWAKVECSGDDHSHPKVYYSLKINEEKSCEYCGRTWKRIKIT